MNRDEFRKQAHEVADWMADYLEDISGQRVTPEVSPGDIKQKLPGTAPEAGEDFGAIFDDFKSVILPGMTHWQHPGFFGYFPANNSEPSILAEMITATMGAQCMVWLTSPAAEELEERMMEWLRDLLGLPETFTGVIQDSSSSATLVTLLTAREKRSDYAINQQGYSGNEKYRVYASEQAHSSVDKGVRIAGFGHANLVKIGTDDTFAMRTDLLDDAIRHDLETGFTPLAVVSTFGTTGSTAVDPVGRIDAICKRYNIWHHVDASYAGTALMLPEVRATFPDAARCDSFVVNPHKWMFTNFDCSAYFVRDRKALTDTFAILPEYLKTDQDRLVNNYRDWGVPLGRRFRALKLWFVMRRYGILGLQEKIRNHITYGQWVKEQVISNGDLELLAPAHFNLVCFRFHPDGMNETASLNRLNEAVLRAINRSGRVFLTHTKLGDAFAIRFVNGQTDISFEEVRRGWEYVVTTGMAAVAGILNGRQENSN